jgi:hypothetical protein
MACGGSSNPTGPTGSAQVCRTYATAFQSVNTVSLGSDSADIWQLMGTCRWEINRLVCEQQYTFLGGDCSGAAGRATRTQSYRSPTDFVDEVSVIPPLPRALSISILSAADSCPSSVELTNSYDARGRLTQRVGRSPRNLAANVTTTYSAWDALGRPTAGASANFLGNVPVSIVYDSAGRRSAETAQHYGGQWVLMLTTEYDRNGNVAREVLEDVTPGESGERHTTTTTVTATDRVCK